MHIGTNCGTKERYDGDASVEDIEVIPVAGLSVALNHVGRGQPTIL